MKFSAKTVAVAVVAVALSSVGLGAAQASVDMHASHSSSISNISPEISHMSTSVEMHVAHLTGTSQNSEELTSLFEHCAFACVMCLITFIVIRISRKLGASPLISQRDNNFFDNFSPQRLVSLTHLHSKPLVLRM